MRIGRRGVEKVQAENRRLGIPNVYAVDGVVMYELLDGTLSRIDPMTEYQDVDDVEGCIIAANHKRRVRIGNRYGIVLHNQWTSDVERKVPQGRSRSPFRFLEISQPPLRIAKRLSLVFS